MTDDPKLSTESNDYGRQAFAIVSVPASWRRHKGQQLSEQHQRPAGWRATTQRTMSWGAAVRVSTPESAWTVDRGVTT